jgi:hypothetical protein
MINFEYASFLYIVLLVALIPLVLLLTKAYTVKISTASQTFIKFYVKAAAEKWWIATFIGLLGLVLLFTKFDFLNLLLYIFFLREVILEYQLERFEIGNVLVHDYESGTYEYSGTKISTFFNQQDVTSVILYEYPFRMKKAMVADVYFGSKSIRITSGLADFDKIPLLESKITAVYRYYSKLNLPAIPT